MSVDVWKHLIFLGVSLFCLPQSFAIRHRRGETPSNHDDFVIVDDDLDNFQKGLTDSPHSDTGDFQVVDDTVSLDSNGNYLGRSAQEALRLLMRKGMGLSDVKTALCDHRVSSQLHFAFDAMCNDSNATDVTRTMVFEQVATVSSEEDGFTIAGEIGHADDATGELFTLSHGLYLLLPFGVNGASRLTLTNNRFGDASRNFFTTIADIVKDGKFIAPLALIVRGAPFSSLGMQHMVLGIFDVVNAKSRSRISKLVLRDSLHGWLANTGLERFARSFKAQVDVVGDLVDVQHEYYDAQFSAPFGFGDGRVCGAHTVALLSRIVSSWLYKGKHVLEVERYGSQLTPHVLEAIALALYQY